jgi:hypothetical protein
LPVTAALSLTSVDDAPQQGDILFAAVARVIAVDEFVPFRWAPLDEVQVELATEMRSGDATVPALQVAAGRALVMVTTQDCGMELSGSERGAAMMRVENRVDLDRNFQVSPLIDPTTQRLSCVSEEARDQLRFALARLDVL